ncbi:hypothetical protein GYMLUDRAFT_85547 [Collybiopsis luxurians FD-317 M1]|uniref:DUF6533 domain-containing protein n=1 Tax=Collybiopsis luxurians FD-317 M1 TaxID=944289 RepID=A0A0D0CBW8_9AGAR|nr:hypothetical protein GYMLUDRAFT_85547 [Collybiopsis luxurians FD-317 M1]
MAELPEADFLPLARVRYLTGVALVLIIYNHLLTLNEEIETIWTTGRNYLQKLTFALNRYGVETIVIYSAYVYGGSATRLDDNVCHLFNWIFAVAGMGITVITQSFITLRVYRAWDKRRGTSIALLVVFVIFIAASIPNAVLSILEIQQATHFFPEISACAILTIPPFFPVTLGIFLLLDLVIVTLAIFYALERPYRTNVDVLDSLHRDGAKLFIALRNQAICSLRLISLVISVVGEPSDCYGVLCLVWTLMSIINSHFQMRVEGLKNYNFGFQSSNSCLIF